MKYNTEEETKSINIYINGIKIISEPLRHCKGSSWIV
jgi:hypothetical protein